MHKATIPPSAERLEETDPHTANAGRKREKRQAVEPGETGTGMHDAASRHSAGVMSEMKGPVETSRQMNVGRAAEKRQYAKEETHQEAEKIEIGPGHKSPRARHLLCATCRCGARAGIRVTDPVDCPGHHGPALLNCEVVSPAADGRCPSVVLRSDDCPDAKLLRGVRLNRASEECPPRAKSPDANPHAPRSSGVRVAAPDQS